MILYCCSNANKHGHSQSVGLNATSTTISVTKFGPETLHYQLMLSLNFFITTPSDGAILPLYTCTCLLWKSTQKWLSQKMLRLRGWICHLEKFNKYDIIIIIIGGIPDDILWYWIPCLTCLDEKMDILTYK